MAIQENSSASESGANLPHRSGRLSNERKFLALLLAQAARPDSKRHLGNLLSFLGTFLMPALLCGVLATLASYAFSPKHAARADIMIHVQQSGDAVQRYHSSQAIIIKGSAMLATLARTTGLEPDAINEALSVDFPKGGNIMRLQYVSHDPDLALNVLRKSLESYETLIGPIEVDENAGHQIVSPPALLSSPVFPQRPQFAAIGVVLGLLFSMARLALARQMSGAVSTA